jgi:hypothetical protein
VVGNQPKTIPDAKVKKLPQPVVFNNKTYDAHDMTHISVKLPQGNYAGNSITIRL